MYCIEVSERVAFSLRAGGRAGGRPCRAFAHVGMQPASCSVAKAFWSVATTVWSLEVQESLYLGKSLVWMYLQVGDSQHAYMYVSTTADPMYELMQTAPHSAANGSLSSPASRR